MEGRKSFLLRMDPKLYKELEGWAQEEFRSVNSQVEFLLKRAIGERKKGKGSGQDVESENPQ